MKARKFIAGFSALTLAATMSMTAFAATEPTEINEKSDPQSGQAEITTEIAPTYIVTIPADTTVAFNDTETDFGTVELTQARLDPDKQVVVTVETDSELKNAADSEKVIPYILTAQYISGDEGEEYMPFTATEEPLIMDTEGQKFAMTIEIDEEDWNAAYAGSYSDTVIFNIDYIDAEGELPEDMVDIAYTYEYFDDSEGGFVPVNGHYYMHFNEGDSWADAASDSFDLEIDGNMVIFKDDEHDVELQIYEGTVDNIVAAVNSTDQIDHNKSYVAIESEF